MRFGGFGRFPAPMGGGKPNAQAMYDAMIESRGRGRYSRSDDAIVNRELKCYAHVLDCAESYQGRGFLQFHPGYATDLLPEWEQRLGVTPDPNDTPGQRRAMLEAIVRSNGDPTYDNIVSALELVLDGEVVTIVAAKPAVKTFGATIAYTPGVSAHAGGNLSGATHHVAIAIENTLTGVIVASTLTAGASTAGSFKLRVAPIAIVVPGEIVHYYLSVSPGSLSLAYVATGPGGSMELGDYPGNPGTPGNHHLGIIVSTATRADARKVRRIHSVLGPMLSAWTTYDIVTSSPFILGTDIAAGASPLGTGAL